MLAHREDDFRPFAERRVVSLGHVPIPLLEIDPRAEMPAGAGHNHHAAILRLAQAVQQGPARLPIHGVGLFGPFQGEQGACAVDPQRHPAGIRVSRVVDKKVHDPPSGQSSWKVANPSTASRRVTSALAGSSGSAWPSAMPHTIICVSGMERWRLTIAG